MKVKLKYGISAYSGTIDDITFGSYRNGRVCIARRYVIPKATAQNEKMAGNAKNLVQIYRACSEGYKADLKEYAYRLSMQKKRRNRLPVNAYSVFMMMMYAFQKDNAGSIGLDSLTYGDITTLFTDLHTISDAIDVGYLPPVPGSEDFSAEI